MTPQYSIPGTGTLKIAALAGNQKATKTQTKEIVGEAIDFQFHSNVV